MKQYFGKDNYRQRHTKLIFYIIYIHTNADVSAECKRKHKYGPQRGHKQIWIPTEIDTTIVACSFDSVTQRSIIIRSRVPTVYNQKPYSVYQYRMRIQTAHCLLKILQSAPRTVFHFAVHIKANGVLFTYAKGVTRFIENTGDDKWIHEIKSMFV